MLSLLNFILSLTWQDLLDVLLCTYIVFRLYVLFRGTAVLRVLIGIALLVAAQRCAAFLGLVLTSWAIQGITAAAALIIIVVFRNEIRSVLQARNLKAVFWGSPLKKTSAPVAAVAEAVFELARKRCGALMVFPGKDDIRDLLHSGTPLDCLVSGEMLAGLFVHDNPLHDGAVVLQNERITQAGVVLPVSHRADLPSSYGTRHRAALGLSERCDALVVVVSEERGSVTVCRGGSMTVIHNPGELTRAIQEHIHGHRDQLDYRDDGRREAIAAICVSFVLVGAVWFGFTRGSDTFMSFDVPLEYMNRDPALDIADASVNSVRVHLSGSGLLIKSLRPEQVRVRLDLGRASAGINTFSISTEQIQVPPGVVVKKAEPASVDIVLDTIMQKKLPVQADWTGRLPGGMRITSCTLDPAEIIVEGSQQVLADIATLYTEKINIETLPPGGSVTVPIVLAPPSLRILSGSDRVTVHFVMQSLQEGARP